MDHSTKANRISRVLAENIAQHNFFKPVTKKNDVFGRLKKNSDVLSRYSNHQELQDKENSHLLKVLNEKSLNKKSTHRQQVNSTQFIVLQKQKSFSLSLNKQSIKNLPISPTLPLISQSSKQIFLHSPRNNLLLKQKRNFSPNVIQGTNLGILSTRQILKQYEMKKIRQELDKKSFLDNYIKNINLQDCEIDSEGQNEGLKQKEKARFFEKPQVSSRSNLQQNKSLNVSQSQQKLTELLNNRLTDRDYIDFNVKLFQKRDITKKRYFQRYHNILKKQRQQIS